MCNTTITVSKKTADKIDRLKDWIGIRKGTCAKLLIYEQHELFIKDSESFERALLKKKQGINRENKHIPVSYSEEYTKELYNIEKMLNDGKEENSPQIKLNTILEYMIMMELDNCFVKDKTVNKKAKGVIALSFKNKEEFENDCNIFRKHADLDKNALNIAEKINITSNSANRWIIARYYIKEVSRILIDS